jgi:hypothetical protein
MNGLMKKRYLASLLACFMGGAAGLPGAAGGGSTAPAPAGSAAEPLRYSGAEQPDPAYFDGRLRHAVGVHRFQAFRANRTFAPEGGLVGWTYNHAPMLAHWQGRFWLQYLSDLREEHAPPGRSLVLSSVDGREWTAPQVVFPEIHLPAVTPPARFFNGTPLPEVPHGTGAIMHQRMGWYVAPNGRLLSLGFYSYCPNTRWGPNRGHGIGRVVREVHLNGQFGPVHFIRYNREAGWDETNTPWFSFYRTSADSGFVAACDALLADRLMTLAWWEEDRQQDGFFALDPGSEEPKAFSWFVRRDGTTVGVWKKHSALSPDGGRTWGPLAVMPTLWDVNGKIWVQRMRDDRYALVHTQSATRRNRFPLVIMTGDDGRDFPEMLVLHGEASPMRYQGINKNIGPQYIRGILPGNGTAPDGDMWITYSMNKEDMWVARVPSPVRATVDRPVDDDFESDVRGANLAEWNVHSPLWAPVRVAADPANPSNHCLELRDRDPWEYAKAERPFPASERVAVEFRVLLAHPGPGRLEVEVQGARGERPLRLRIDDEWLMLDHVKAEPASIAWQTGRWHAVRLEIDTARGSYDCWLDGKLERAGVPLQDRVAQVQRIEFRTGAWRQDVPWPIHRGEPGSPGVYLEDLPGADTPVAESVYYVDDVRTAPLR